MLQLDLSLVRARLETTVPAFRFVGLAADLGRIGTNISRRWWA